MIIENVVAQILTSIGKKLYFYCKTSYESSRESMEIDFLVAKRQITNRHNISPIEVKSSSRYTLSSLTKFRKRFPEQINEAYVIHTSDYKEEDGVTYLPIYMAYLL